MSGRILNIGSINIDYVYRVPHFVQPGETLASQSFASGLGGKGANQSVAIASAGGQVTHLGKVGSADTWAIEQLSQAGVDTSLIETSNGASVTRSFRLMTNAKMPSFCMQVQITN